MIHAKRHVFCKGFVTGDVSAAIHLRFRTISIAFYLHESFINDPIIPTLLAVVRYLAVALLCMSHSSAQEPPLNPALSVHSPREVHDLAYLDDGEPDQRLDLVVPVFSGSEGGGAPLIVWIHGGGWEQGSHHQSPAHAMAARGYAVASIGYRLSSQARYPAQIEDCKAAVRWLRAHAGDYGIDPARIGVWGASAGGHLAALLGTTAKDRRFDVGENLDQSSAVLCVIDSFGPADFLHWGDPPLPASYDTPYTAVARLLGGKVSEHEELARQASPINFVNKDSVPFLLMHGEKDPIVPVQQSILLDAALRKAGVASTLVVVPGGGHGGAVFSDARYLRQMAAFMDAHLLRPTPATR